MSIGDDSGTAFQTLRGRDYPGSSPVHRFSGEPCWAITRGRLNDLKAPAFGSVALSISDAAECAFVRFLVSDADLGREILERGGLAIIETDLVGVELPSGQQPLLRVCTALLQAELNITQAYPLIVRPNGKPAVAIMVDNTEVAMQTLLEKGFTIITEADLEDNPTKD